MVDTEYPGRILLAEANQWPSDVIAYFGTEEEPEFHMAFHFPLMPRMFMAMRQETRTPIVEIMQSTPDIPAGCQWAIFLRNHDELTLEMVTDAERDYMYYEYARDPRNAHQRRHSEATCPLMDNGRRQIEMMNSLLLSMPEHPSSTTATRSAWATTSTWATAMACARRCSGPSTATPDSPERLGTALFTRKYGCRLWLPGRQRRRAIPHPHVAAELDAPHDRRAQALPGIWPGLAHVFSTRRI